MDTDMLTEFEKRHVDRGIEVLDRNIPGWDERIDIPSLDIRSTHCCLVAQLFNKEWQSIGTQMPDPFTLGMARLRAQDAELDSEMNDGCVTFESIGFAGAEHTPIWREKIVQRRVRRLRTAYQEAVEV